MPMIPYPLPRITVLARKPAINLLSARQSDHPAQELHQERISLMSCVIFPFYWQVNAIRAN
jgi:hypothetical protein